jgi:hypothetical protein
VVSSSSLTWTFLVIDPCPTATLTGGTTAAQTYYVADSALGVTTSVITSSVPDSICGAVVYNFDDGAGVALDNTVFTQTGTTATISIHTTDATKAGTYTVRALGHQGTYTGHFTSSTFTLTITSCLTNVFTTYVVTPAPSYTVGDAT